MVRYQQGEYGAFEALYERYSRRIFAFLRKQLVDPTEAQDGLQLVFMKIHRHRAKYHPEMPFLPWLFSITRNTVIDLRRKKTGIPTEGEALADMLPTVEENPETPLAVEQVIQGLPPETRELISLRYEEGLSFEEMSRRLGITEPTVRKRVSRAVKRMKTLFGGKDE